MVRQPLLDLFLSSLRRHRGWVVRIAGMLLTVVACTVLVGPRDASARPAPRLVRASPGQFGHRSDARGFRWDINSRGQVNDGSNDAFDGAANLQVNGQTFNCPSPQTTPDGKVTVLSASCGNLQVTRRIRLDAKEATLRYVEVFHNPSNQPAQASIRIYTRLGSQARGIWSDTGRANATGLSKKECGLIGWQQSGSRPSVLFLLRHSPRATALPINVKNRYQFTVNLNRTIKPGKKLVLVHGLAQRRLSSAPTPKMAEKLFDHFKSRAWLEGIPRDLRRNLLNAGGFSFAGMPGADLKSRLEDLDVDRGTSDVLAIGERTRLQGVLRGGNIAIRTPYGQKSYPVAEVAALRGRQARGGRTQLWLRNGQILSGTLEFDGLRFDSRAGPPVSLTPAGVDRVVTRGNEKDGHPGPEVLLFLETILHDRIALTGGSESELSFITPWGVRRVSAEEMRWMKRVGAEVPGYVIGFRPKGRVFGFLQDRRLTFETLDFGTQTFHAAAVRGIYSAAPEEEKEEGLDQVSEPVVRLVGDNVLVGRFEKTRLHFLSQGEVLAVGTDRLRRLVNLSEDEGRTMPSEPVFEAELWDGGIVEGVLRESVLGVRTGDWTARVPVGEIREVRCPAPRVPEDLRNEIAGLIRQLGNSSWEKRRSATAKLREIGSLALPQLREALGQSNDPEVRRRAEKLLEGIEQE